MITAKGAQLYSHGDAKTLRRHDPVVALILHPRCASGSAEQGKERASDAAVRNGDGYTNIELYLNELAKPVRP